MGSIQYLMRHSYTQNPHPPKALWNNFKNLQKLEIIFIIPTPLKKEKKKERVFYHLLYIIKEIFTWLRWACIVEYPISITIDFTYCCFPAVNILKIFKKCRKLTFDLCTSVFHNFYPYSIFMWHIICKLCLSKRTK